MGTDLVHRRRSQGWAPLIVGLVMLLIGVTPQVSAAQTPHPEPAQPGQHSTVVARDAETPDDGPAWDRYEWSGDVGFEEPDPVCDAGIDLDPRFPMIGNWESVSAEHLPRGNIPTRLLLPWAEEILAPTDGNLSRGFIIDLRALHLTGPDRFNHKL